MKTTETHVMAHGFRPLASAQADDRVESWNGRTHGRVERWIRHCSTTFSCRGVQSQRSALNCRSTVWGAAAVAILTALLFGAVGGMAPVLAKSTGGTVTYAELPGTPPNYILPMTSATYYAVNNIDQFSNLLFLPLYVFGARSSLGLNKTLSVAYPPVFSTSNTVVTISLKHWMWSNGQPITARDVIFWMNLISASSDPSAPPIGSSSLPGPGWAGAVPGEFPENVVSYTQTGTYTVVFHLNASYNSAWFLDEELSQIYPLPQKAWDKLSAGGSIGNYDAQAEARSALPNTSPAQYVPSHPGNATSGALGVAQFLNAASEDLGTYSTNPLWQVVDGPFRLVRFTTSGFVKMVPNKAYSGSPKPTIGAFEEEPYTTDGAEYNALRSGSLTIGYIPTEDLSQKASLEKELKYKYSPWNVFGANFSTYNFTNPIVGPIFQQLYFRQAFQSLIDQSEYIKDFAGGAGTVTSGVVPTYPVGNSYVSPLTAHGQVYPYSPAKAVKLLKAHGWTVRAGGTSMCSRPGTGPDDCGAGIKSGQPASFKLLYESGSTELTNEMDAMQSTMKAKAGIDITLSQASFAQVIGTAFTGCSSADPCSGWDIVDWATTDSWAYPYSFPDGGITFTEANPGGYTSATNSVNIAATHTALSEAAEQQAMFKYENYVARQLPYVFVPNGPFQLTMYKSSLKGLVPQGVLNALYPQFYSLG